MLDTKHRLIRTSVVSVGTLDSSPATAIDFPARLRRPARLRFVLFHNSPVGRSAAEPGRYRLTRRLAQAGEIMGIDVIDHVILADTRYFSFREAGRL